MQYELYNLSNNFKKFRYQSEIIYLFQKSNKYFQKCSQYH